jgi:hypothetical protein
MLEELAAYETLPGASSPPRSMRNAWLGTASSDAGGCNLYQPSRVFCREGSLAFIVQMQHGLSSFFLHEVNCHLNKFTTNQNKWATWFSCLFRCITVCAIPSMPVRHVGAASLSRSIDEYPVKLVGV